MLNPFGIIEERNSPHNGRIVVLGGFEGPRILVGGLSQSGWLVRKIWQAALKRALQDLPRPENVLILGLGGGSSAELVQKYCPLAMILGIDIDSEIVDLGKKYLRLDNVNNLEILITDAREWVDKQTGKSTQKIPQKYDLILIDLFVGTKIPEYFKSEVFFKKVKRLLSPRGIVCCNHFYAGKDRESAHKFLQVLRNVFGKIVWVTPEANIIYLCFNT